MLFGRAAHVHTGGAERPEHAPAARRPSAIRCGLTEGAGVLPGRARPCFLAFISLFRGEAAAARARGARSLAFASGGAAARRRRRSGGRCVLLCGAVRGSWKSGAPPVARTRKGKAGRCHLIGWRKARTGRKEGGEGACACISTCSIGIWAGTVVACYASSHMRSGGKHAPRLCGRTVGALREAVAGERSCRRVSALVP